MLNRTDLSRTDLNLLVLFQIVREELHVGRAAERLSLSASAVSHGLGRLRRLMNDPLFLKTPTGVVPTARAIELTEPIADILARVKGVVAMAEPFDAARSTRRFTIGTADGFSVFLAPLLADLSRTAPGIDLVVRHVQQETVFSDIDARIVDAAVAPFDDLPARFFGKTLYEEDFEFAMRIGHPFADDPTLDRYCEMRHLLVAPRGDAHGVVDERLAKLGRSRRVALAVPNFMLALDIISRTDLISSLPKSFVTMNAERFGVTSTVVPPLFQRLPIRAVAPKVAMMDAGMVWLFEALGRAVRTAGFVQVEGAGAAKSALG